jgi:hypothetical protein
MMDEYGYEPIYPYVDMTRGEPCRPNEGDMIEAPQKPDLRCREHGVVCEDVRELHRRVRLLELKVRKLMHGALSLPEEA